MGGGKRPQSAPSILSLLESCGYGGGVCSKTQSALKPTPMGAGDGMLSRTLMLSPVLIAQAAEIFGGRM